MNLTSKILFRFFCCATHVADCPTLVTRVPVCGREAPLRAISSSASAAADAAPIVRRRRRQQASTEGPEFGGKRERKEKKVSKVPHSKSRDGCDLAPVPRF
jgi:hypothetical protein